MNRRKVPVMGVLLALALVFSYVESLIPFYFGVPGMKLGLTNTVVVLVLYLYGAPMALLISFLSPSPTPSRADCSVSSVCIWPAVF